MKLSTTLLFTLRADSKANQVQTHQEAGLHKQWTKNLHELHTCITGVLIIQQTWFLTLWKLIKLSITLLLSS